MPKMTELSRRIRKIYLLRRSLFGKLAADLDIDMQQGPILEYIKKNPGCTQVELAKALAVSAASIAFSTKRMQKSGLLNKEVDERNLRQNRLSITEKGLETSQKCKGIAQNLNQLMFDGFSEEELDALEAYLDRIIHNLSSDKAEEDFSLLSIVALENQLSLNGKEGEEGKND